MLRIQVDEDFVCPRAPLDKPRRSISLSLPSLVVINGALSRKSFSYSKLPEEPIKLIVHKLDGSNFHVNLTKSATIAELKLAVQDVFSHVPKKGPEKISWPHVWAHFCLSYDGQKLVTDTDQIINYGIKDGDQLHFIRHVSSIYNLTKVRSKTKNDAPKQSYLSINSSGSSLESELNDEDDEDYDDMENGRYGNGRKDEDKHDNRPSPVAVVEQECQLGHLRKSWSSYSKVSSTPRRKRSSKGIVCQSSRYNCSVLGNFRKILQLWNYSSRRILRED